VVVDMPKTMKGETMGTKKKRKKERKKERKEKERRHETKQGDILQLDRTLIVGAGP
jgi:hypothetical protein